MDIGFVVLARRHIEGKGGVEIFFQKEIIELFESDINQGTVSYDGR